MQDAWRAYLEVALGLTEASKKKAQQIARKLVGQGGATAAQLQAFAEELLSTSAANRESLIKLVRFEVDRALGLVGLATAEEVADLTARVQKLERELREARVLASASASTVATLSDAGGSVGDAALASALGEVPGAEPAVKPAAAKKTVAKKTVAKKAVVKKAVARTGTKAVAKQTPAKKAAAKKVAS